MRKGRLHLRPTTAWMLVILLIAVTMRFVLMKLNWPVTNGDESIIDLMARHITFQGEHPIFFWGQNRMGSLQAYLGAIMIRFFGSSTFSVRLGTLLIFALYIVCMYCLVRLLSTPAFALFIVTLLSIGSDRIVSIPLVANGGYAETMLFGALIFLLVTWLALTVSGARLTWPRLLVYAGLGVVVGLSLWSDQLILAAVFMAGLFLWLCCRQEIRGWTICALFGGLFVGALPLIIYNLSAPLAQNSLFVLVGTVFSLTPRTIPFSEQIAHVLLISLPLGTDMPFTTGTHQMCSTSEPYLRPTSSLAALFPFSNPWLCIGIRGGWSLGILILWSIALAKVLLILRRRRKARQEAIPGSSTLAEWQERVRQYARLMLLGSGALWLLLFTFSAGAEFTPRASYRYLICLLLAAPAVLWPLWEGISRAGEGIKQGQRYIGSRFVGSVLALCVITSIYFVGVGDIIANLPTSQSSYNQVNVLLQTLLEHGATRFYSDYNTCNQLIFQSNERVVCSVLDDRLQPGTNRYAPYTALVAAAPHPAYLFFSTSAPARALARRIGNNGHYQHMFVDGYILYY